MSCAPLATRLENYTLSHPEEVLLVQVTVDDEPDQILIFKGFSSSLMRSTAFDPEVPVLPEAAVIQSIDRLKGPYLPQSPSYIEQNIPLQDFLIRLDQSGL
ncbi:MAG: hypothetical protein AAFQ74_16330 [Cyanobacteria bacterium J06623_4]